MAYRFLNRVTKQEQNVVHNIEQTPRSVYQTETKKKEQYSTVKKAIEEGAQKVIGPKKLEYPPIYSNRESQYNDGNTILTAQKSNRKSESKLSTSKKSLREYGNIGQLQARQNPISISGRKLSGTGGS